MAEKDMKFDTCYASHVRWDIPTGNLSCCQGSAMSGLYHFVLEINGKGGHVMMSAFYVCFRLTEYASPRAGHSALSVYIT